jgi:hypothetical protein
MRLFCVCVVLCLGRGLATSWSLAQGVLSSVKWSWNWKAEARAQGGCTASDKKNTELYSWLNKMDDWPILKETRRNIWWSPNKKTIKLFTTIVCLVIINNMVREFSVSSRVWKFCHTLSKWTLSACHVSLFELSPGQRPGQLVQIIRVEWPRNHSRITLRLRKTPIGPMVHSLYFFTSVMFLDSIRSSDSSAIKRLSFLLTYTWEITEHYTSISGVRTALSLFPDSQKQD